MKQCCKDTTLIENATVLQKKYFIKHPPHPKVSTASITNHTITNHFF